MPIKARRHKGRKAPIRKITRKELDPVKKSAIVILRRMSLTERAVAEQTKIDKSTVHRVYKRTMNNSQEFQIAVDSPNCDQVSPRSDRPRYPFEKDAQELFEYVISTSEIRRMTAVEIINELHFSDQKSRKLLSESKFCQIMYDREYGRGSAG